MDERIEAAKRVIEGAMLRDIRLAAGRMERSISHPGELAEPTMEIKHSAWASRNDQNSFVVDVRFLLLIYDGPGQRPEEAEDCELEVPICVEAVFELQYSHPDAASLGDEALLAFAGTNGVFNAWPYFREFAQSSFQRMGLPPTTIPLFRLSPPQPAGQEPGAATPAPSVEELPITRGKSGKTKRK